MKLEIVKSTNINGDVDYFIKADNNCLERYKSNDLSKVKAMYERIVESGSLEGKIEEILICTEI